MANANGIQTEDETTNMIMPTTNASVGISNGERVYMRFVASIASLQSPYSGTYTSLAYKHLEAVLDCRAFLCAFSHERGCCRIIYQVDAHMSRRQPLVWERRRV